VAAQPVEDIAKAIGQAIEHQNPATSG
jgi:hypothetical protein